MKRTLMFAALFGLLQLANADAQLPPLRIGMEEDLSTSMSAVYATLTLNSAP